MKFQKGNKGYWLGKKRPNLWKGERLDMEGKHFSPNTEIKKRQHISKETEFKKGSIPFIKGKHHLDFNPRNNSPKNLQLLENKYHHKAHMFIQKTMR